MKISGIYKIQSLLKSERYYIGSAIDVNKRKSDHFSLLKLNKHHSIKLQNHYNKYGESDLVFIIIEPCFHQFLIIQEQYYIDKLKPWFNICKKAGSQLGMKRSYEICRKMGKTHIGQIGWNKGIPMNEETKRKQSESHKGQIAWNKGKYHSEETKQKQREIKLGKKASEETRIKQSISHIGLHAGEKNPMFGKIPWNKGKKGVQVFLRNKSGRFIAEIIGAGHEPNFELILKNNEKRN